MSVRHGLRRSTSPHPQPYLSRIRPKTVRAKIVTLLAVPVISLMALWALATVSAVQSAWTLQQVKELDTNMTGPLTDLVTNLEAERVAVVRYLAAPDAAGQQTVTQLHTRSDAAMTRLRNGVMAASVDVASLAPTLNQRIETVARDISVLHNDNTSIIAKQLDFTSAYNAYTTAIDDVFAVSGSLASVQGAQDPNNAAAAQVVLTLRRVNEMLERQDAVATATQASGRMSAEEYQAFLDAMGGQRVLADSVRPDLGSAEQTAYERLVGTNAYQSLSAMQSAVLADGVNRAVSNAIPADRWRTAIQPVEQSLTAIQTSAAAAASATMDASSSSALRQGAVTVILGLVAVLLALLISVQIGRGMVIELVELRNSALELAGRRLPQAMRRLRAGEKIDVAAEVPVVPPAEGEVGQVGEALNAVQRSALQAAAERAELLTGVSGVFVNLARRSQSLVHRQLTLLDSMERRTENPAELEDLFRIDHLATRMRRHAEGLIIMSGAAPGRAWSKPVPLTNVIRSAVAEVEDYTRVEVRRMPDVSVQGTAVADLTHLIAELVENATSFSPPNTTVLVHGEPVGAGFAVEIEDRGLGMRPDTMAEANRRIAEAYQLDLFDGDRLGLFVVSRLANRQNVDVSLRRSPYGGTTAVVLLPTAMLTASEPLGVAVRRERVAAPFDPFFAQDDDAVVAAGTTVAARVPARAVASANRRSSPTVPRLAPRPAHAQREPTSAAPLPEIGGPAKTSESSPGEPAPAATGPRGDQATGPRGDQVTGPRGDQVTGGLPRRIRQASIAPGLRRSDTRDSGTEETDAVVPPSSPEQARATMAALQQGLNRGRSTPLGPSSDT